MSYTIESTRRTWTVQICLLSEKHGALGTSDISRSFSIGSSSAYVRLESAVQQKLMTVDRSQYRAAYRVVRGWRKVAGNDVAGIEPVAFVAPAAKKVRASKTAERLNKRPMRRGAHLDKPSASVCLHAVWGWVRPAVGVAA